MEDTAQLGLGSLADYLKCSRRTIYRKLPELKKAGVVTPRLVNFRRSYMWFPSIVQRYYAVLGSEGKRF